MNRFKYFIRLDENSAHNSALGHAYETATALYLHHNSGSKHNPDPAHQKKMADMKDSFRSAMKKLPPEKRKTAKSYGKASAHAYLKSLKDNHGIHPKDVKEVHHTYAGIDKLVGKKVSQAQNPHDVAIKTHSGKIHGASLKYKSGTLSNSPVKSFDNISKAHGIHTDHHSIWQSGKKAAGLEGKTQKEVKSVRHLDHIKKANNETQKMSAEHHAAAFNKASHANQKKFLHHITKSNPDVNYDYVVGSKGSAHPVNDHPIHKLIKGAKKFKAVHNGTNLVKIHDHDNKHVMTFEHRPTHGAFSSVQINGKYGTGK